MASPALTSSIITLIVGPEQRLFAAHEDVLCISPFFASACRNQFLDNTSKRIALPDEEPEIFSSVLEYLYKGDYYPRLVHDKRRGTWALESGSEVSESTIYHHGVDGDILKDTVIYCTADKYGLDELKRVALRKQGLRKIPILDSVSILTLVFQSLEFNAAPFLPLLATPIAIHPTPTRLFARTISPL